MYIFIYNIVTKYVVSPSLNRINLRQNAYITANSPNRAIAISTMYLVQVSRKR